jgi:dTDP-glucose 4,6-dehydratase
MCSICDCSYTKNPVFDDLTFLNDELLSLDIRRNVEWWFSLKDSRILMTGGTGLFGKWLLAALIHLNGLHKLGIECEILTRDPDGFRRAMPALAAQHCLSLIKGDVRFFEFPKGRFTHVIHAATDSSRQGQRDPVMLIDTIIAGTRRVLEFARRSRAGRVLLISSGAIYGQQPCNMERIPENYTGAYDPADPASAYAQAKRMAENIGAVYNKAYSMEVVIARGFAFVGPYLPLDTHFAIGNFIRDALESDVITVKGDGSPVRSYLYMADLAAWLLKLLLHGRGGAAYNVGSDAGINIADLAACVRDELAPGKEIIVEGREMSTGTDRSRYVPSIDLARSELGLDVWTSLPEGVRRTARWYKAWRRENCSMDTPKAVFDRDVKKFVIDIDGIIASLVPGNDYAQAKPLGENIRNINLLHDAGHKIVLFTARGSETGIDWNRTTEEQLLSWGVKYHELMFGKPAADYYIDDRMLPVDFLTNFARDD